MNIVIVAPEHTPGIAGDFRIWAKQYVKKAPKERGMVTIASAKENNAVVAATREATQRAGKTGWVIYAVGHGWGTSKHPLVGNADLGPKLRVTEYVAFYHPTSSYSGCELKKAADEFDEAKSLPRKIRKPALKNWCENYKVKGKQCEQLKKKVGNRAVIQGYYDQIAAAFHQFKVGRVFLLSCSIGQSRAFLDELSTDFGLPVGAYRRQVVAAKEKNKKNPRVWVYLDGDERGSGTFTDEALTELPGRGISQVVWGEVVVGKPPKCGEDEE